MLGILAVCGRGARGATPVSYTHLDVYKRQLLPVITAKSRRTPSSEDSAAFTFRVCFHSTGTVPSPTHRPRDSGPGTLGPVSYTHLLQGVLSFFSPCVLPLVPLYIGYLSGGARTVEPDGSVRYRRRRVLGNTFFFVLGVSFAFFLLGLGFTAAGRFFSRYQSLFTRAGGKMCIRDRTWTDPFYGDYKYAFLTEAMEAGDPVADTVAEYRTLVEAAIAETSDMARRYELFAAAEAYLIDHALATVSYTHLALA